MSSVEQWYENHVNCPKCRRVAKYGLFQVILKGENFSDPHTEAVCEWSKGCDWKGKVIDLLPPISGEMGKALTAEQVREHFAKAGVKCPCCVRGVVMDDCDNFPPDCGACDGTGWLTKDRVISLYTTHKVIHESLDTLKKNLAQGQMTTKQAFEELQVTDEQLRRRFNR